MGSWVMDCVEKPIRARFFCLGKFIGAHPWYFVVIPLVASAALGGGFYFLNDLKRNNIAEQFTPKNGRAKSERRFIQETFPEDEEQFSAMRLSTDGSFAALIFSSDTNVLGSAALGEVMRMDSEVRAITTKEGAQTVRFEDVCARTNGTCSSSPVLGMLNYNVSRVGSVNITYPEHCVSEFNCIHMGSVMGDVEMDHGGAVRLAKAIKVFYYLDERNQTLGDVWLDEFQKLLSNMTTTFTNISYFTSASRQEEFEKSTGSVTTLFALTYVLAISFSTISCLRLDGVRNKVWVAFLGVCSTALAVLGSFGLLLLLKVPFVITAASSPFLILGIGLDDMFIMISSWQRTSVQDKVPDRMAETYREAAISITITSVTDVLAFYLSFSNPFGSVQSFCFYSGTAVLFCYIYNITFFGACLALNGRREEENRHCLTCMKVPEESSSGQGKAYTLCCVGGAFDPTTKTEEEHPVTLFFKKYYGPILISPWTKRLVMFLYVTYVAISVYGCLRLKEGIDLKNLALDTSYVVQYYEDQQRYFSYYGPHVMVAINQSLPYWEKNARDQLESCIDQFQDLGFTLSTSWLHSYERFSENHDYNISSEKTFSKHLPQFLDQNPILRRDVNVTKDGRVAASRLFLQTVVENYTDKSLLSLSRTSAERCLCPLVVYHPAFVYYDQYSVIGSVTLQTVAVATAVMLLVSLLLIPNLLCALCVAFAIVSVVLGVSGSMALLNINLDSISMINLVISIGFSVDFSAHISYMFVSSSRPDVDGRVVEALTALGFPVLQGAFSTLVGVVVLSVSGSYIFRTLFTIVFLVITFGLLHAIVFIPVFLTFSGFCYKKE